MTTVRPATPDDLATIVAFNAALADESEGKKLDPAVLEKGVAWALTNRETATYFVAENEPGQVIGQCMLTYEWTDWRDGWLWWFQSVYVRPDARGQGVFRALFDHVRALADASDQFRGLRLYVEENNTRAQATYRALGMTPAGYLVFADPPCPD